MRFVMPKERKRSRWRPRFELRVETVAKLVEVFLIDGTKFAVIRCWRRLRIFRPVWRMRGQKFGLGQPCGSPQSLGIRLSGRRFVIVAGCEQKRACGERPYAPSPTRRFQ